MTDPAELTILVSFTHTRTHTCTHIHLSIHFPSANLGLGHGGSNFSRVVLDIPLPSNVFQLLLGGDQPDGPYRLLSGFWVLLQVEHSLNTSKERPPRRQSAPPEPPELASFNTKEQRLQCLYDCCRCNPPVDLTLHFPTFHK